MISSASYGSVARILAFAGVAGAIHCGDHAELYLSDRAHAAHVVVDADAVGIDVEVTHASTAEQAEHGHAIKLVATFRPEPVATVHTRLNRMCDRRSP